MRLGEKQVSIRFRKFFSYYRPYLRLFLMDIACALIASAAALAIPLCIRHSTKYLLEIHSSDALSHLYAMGYMILALIIIHTLCHAFVDYKGHMMGALIERDMRNELFAHYQKLSFKFYDETKTGQLMSRITNDSFDLAELYHHGPEEVILSLTSCLGIFIILFSIHIQLSLLVLFFLFIMGIYGFYFSKKMYISLKKNRDRMGSINAHLEDTLSGIRVVKAFANEEVEKKNFAAENNRFLESRKESYKSETSFFVGLMAFMQLITMTVIIVGSTYVVESSLDLADLLTFILYVGILLEPIRKLGNLIRLYQQGITGFNRFMEALEIEPDIKDIAQAKELSHIQGNIEFKNVSFKYKEEHAHILNNISFEIKTGEYVALVGLSGAGKTTLCSLIPRFYEINEGHITIDGNNIMECSLHSLRKNIGIVQQDVYLFSGTVFDNIRYGDLTSNEDEIIEAAKQAHAHDFIMALPNGYSTDIGQRGVKLSGGEKQRIAVARVFLKNPPIIIFDEATSALDGESEKAVQSALEKLIRNRTTIIIAHRLSTVRNAHKILVLTKDGIQEQGTHEELISLNGIYADLYKIKN